MVSVVDQQSGVNSKDAPDADRWLATIELDRSEDEKSVIRRAVVLAQKAYEGRADDTGAPLFLHALAVARILTALRLDHETISAAILHSIVSDTPVSLDMVREAFSERIAKLVEGVLKMDVISRARDHMAADGDGLVQAESLHKMLLAMVEDVRVVLIKMAQWVHVMRGLSDYPAEKQRALAEETKEIFAPLANRLGIGQFKWELEDLAFRALEPEQYKQIARLLDERRTDREQYIAEFIQRLSAELAKSGLDFEISGRPKHIYSIWRKMTRKDVDYSQIYDVRAVRILVSEVPDCYAALGVVHGLWSYVRGEFDDYIATPKGNNYRSLHTAVIGPLGRTVEVQIRTYEMHRHAELGVAAHWAYKEGTTTNSGFERKIAWLRQVLEWKDNVASAGEFVDHVKSEVFDDCVYVFSPKGEVFDLPIGATPLDFAYRIHTEVGHRCRGAKVNGTMVPLTYVLQNGDQIEILTVKEGAPSRDWLSTHLGYISSSRARAGIHSWFRQQNHETSVSEGRASLERELKRLALHDINYTELSKRFDFVGQDALFAAIGRGEMKITTIVNALQHDADRAAPTAGLPDVTVRHEGRRDAPSAAGSDIRIHGVGDLLTQVARCCKPVPNEAIVGYITQGRGVTIHREDCPNILRHHSDSPQRLIKVEWGERNDQIYPVDVRIVAIDRSGLLHDISAILSHENINLLAVNTYSDIKDRSATMTLTMEIPNVGKLSRVLSKINMLPNIIEVNRQVK